MAGTRCEDSGEAIEERRGVVLGLLGVREGRLGDRPTASTGDQNGFDDDRQPCLPCPRHASVRLEVDISSPVAFARVCGAALAPAGVGGAEVRAKKQPVRQTAAARSGPGPTVTKAPAGREPRYVRRCSNDPPSIPGCAHRPKSRSARWIAVARPGAFRSSGRRARANRSTRGRDVPQLRGGWPRRTGVVCRDAADRVKPAPVALTHPWPARENRMES